MENDYLVMCCDCGDVRVDDSKWIKPLDNDYKEKIITHTYCNPCANVFKKEILAAKQVRNKMDFALIGNTNF